MRMCLNMLVPGFQNQYPLTASTCPDIAKFTESFPYSTSQGRSRLKNWRPHRKFAILYGNGSDTKRAACRMLRRAAAEAGYDRGYNWATNSRQIVMASTLFHKSVGLFGQPASVVTMGYRKTGLEYFVNLEPFGERKKTNTR